MLLCILFNHLGDAAEKAYSEDFFVLKTRNAVQE